MKAILGKVIVVFLLASLFIGTFIAVLVNLIDFIEKPTYSGIVFKVEYVSIGPIGPGSGGYDYYVYKDKKVMQGYYGRREKFYLQVGDTITYRRRDFSNRIKALTNNGVKIQNHYGAWDIISLLIVCIMIFGCIFGPRFLKKMKEDHNKRLFENYYD